MKTEQDKLRGEIAYQLTKRLVIDMPTARAAVDAAFKQLAVAPAATEAPSETLRQFAESQRPLPADMAAILDANKWDLYALAAPAAAVPESPAATEAPSDAQIDAALEAWFAGADPVGANHAQDRKCMRAALAAVGESVQPAQADPLQGAANWLVKALVPCSAIEIGWRLSIGHNRAQRLRDNATKGGEAS